MRTTVAILVLAAGIFACRSAPPRDARTAAEERERDSTIGASRLPGAQGVSGALRAADSAAARLAREDSVAQLAQ